MLDLAILGLLHESPMHGYELRKQLTTSSVRSGGHLVRVPVPDATRLQTDAGSEEPGAESTDPRCRR